LLKYFQYLHPVFRLTDDVEIFLQREKTAEAVAKNKIVIRYRNPDFDLARYPGTRIMHSQSPALAPFDAVQLISEFASFY
jgi:hypothetical protein